MTEKKRFFYSVAPRGHGCRSFFPSFFLFFFLSFVLSFFLPFLSFVVLFLVTGLGDGWPEVQQSCWTSVLLPPLCAGSGAETRRYDDHGVGACGGAGGFLAGGMRPAGSRTACTGVALGRL